MSTYCCCGSPTFPVYCRTYIRSVYLWPQKVRRPHDSFLPCHLWLASRGGAGQKGPFPLAAARVEAQLEGLLGWTCWLSQERSAPSRSRVLCCRLCLTWQPEEKRKKAWKEVALHPPLSAGPADPVGAAQKEHLLLLRITTASGLLLDIHSFGFCICILLVSEGAPTRRLPPTSPSLAGWPRGGVRGRGTSAAVSIIPLGSRSGGGPAGRTTAAAGSVWTCWLSQERSAPSRSRVVCCRLCLASQEKKKTGMERSVPTPSAFRRAGWRLALREWHWRSTCCYVSRRQCFLRLSPPTSGLARRGRRRGAQMDGESAVYASRHRLRAWPGGGGRTGSLLSTPPAADFGPGPKGRRRAAQLDGEFAVYASRPAPTSGLALRGRRRGALPWPGVCFPIFHSPASRREAQLYSVTSPNTI